MNDTYLSIVALATVTKELLLLQLSMDNRHEPIAKPLHTLTTT